MTAVCSEISVLDSCSWKCLYQTGSRGWVTGSVWAVASLCLAQR